jgi:hypothetical protein
MSEQEYVYDETIASRYEKAVPVQDGPLCHPERSEGSGPS